MRASNIGVIIGLIIGLIITAIVVTYWAMGRMAQRDRVAHAERTRSRDEDAPS